MLSHIDLHSSPTQLVTMNRPLLLVVTLLAVSVPPSWVLAKSEMGDAAERGLSLSELFRSPIVYDREPITIHAKIQTMAPHPRLLLDEKCVGPCEYVIGYDIADAISDRADIKSLQNAQVDNDHICSTRLKVMVIYKPSRMDKPRPPAGLRIRRLDIIKALGVTCNRAPRHRKWTPLR